MARRDRGTAYGEEGAAPFGVNLIVHKSNPRLEADLELTVRHRVPLVITSLGAAAEVVQVVQGYGGLVFHDVTSVRHAEKAVAAGVDGLIAVAAGAGGHGGTLSPFALVEEIRRIFSGPLALAGAITRGQQIAAARLMGADLAYIGSHFIAAEESLAGGDQKDMMIEANAADIVYTDRVTGIGANFLGRSLAAASVPEQHGALSLSEEARAWKTVWTAGHGVGSTQARRSARALCDDLKHEFEATLQ